MTNGLIRKRVWVPLAVLFFILALGWKAPASTLNWVVPQEVTVHGLEGSVWSGSAASVTVPVEGQRYQLRQLSWTLNPLSVLRFSPMVDIDIQRNASNPAYGQATITATRTGIKVTEARLVSDMARIERVSPVPFIMPLRGDITLNLSHWEWQQTGLCEALDGQLMVMNVSTRLEQNWEALGNYYTDLNCSENRVYIDTDEDNPLGLTVNGWVAMSGMDLAIGIRPGPQAPQPLVNMLEWTGRPDSDGRRTFRLQL